MVKFKHFSSTFKGQFQIFPAPCFFFYPKKKKKKGNPLGLLQGLFIFQGLKLKIKHFSGSKSIALKFKLFQGFQHPQEPCECSRQQLPEVWRQGPLPDPGLDGRLRSQLLSGQQAVQAVQDAGQTHRFPPQGGGDGVDGAELRDQNLRTTDTRTGENLQQL